MQSPPGGTSTGRTLSGAGQRSLITAAGGSVRYGWLGRQPYRVVQLQAVPLRENPVGAELFPVWVAWNPMVVDPPGGMLGL